MSNIFTERHDAFQALMAGTGGVASAAPSGLQTSRMVDDHEDGMTHSCSGCSGGAPCGTCGGNIPRSSPAYQALEWGLWTTASDANTFWRAAAIDQAVRGAPGRTGAQDWTAIESMVRRTQAVGVLSQQGMNAVGAAFDAGMRLSVLTRGGEGGCEDTLLVGGGGDGGFASVLTCVIAPSICGPTLDYHADLPAKQTIPHTVTIDITGKAHFKDDAPYKCACCEFRQSTLASHIAFSGCDKDSDNGRFPKEADEPDMPFDDCQWVYEVWVEKAPGIKEKINVKLAGGSDKPPPLSPEQVAAGYKLIEGPQCYGRRRITKYSPGFGLPMREDPPDGGAGGYGSNPAKSCDYNLNDHPEVTLRKGCHFSWILHLEGSVIPVAGCSGITITKEISVVVSGTTDHNGNVVEYPPIPGIPGSGSPRLTNTNPRPGANWQ